MSYLLILIFLCFGLVFGLSLHGNSGAILSGLGILMLDFFWQLLRLHQIKQASRSRKTLKVTPFFFVRLMSLLILLKTSQAWLTPEYFRVCAAMTLALPVTGIAGACWMMRRD